MEEKEGKGEKDGVFGSDGWMSVDNDDVMEGKKMNVCNLLRRMRREKSSMRGGKRLVEWVWKVEDEGEG